MFPGGLTSSPPLPLQPGLSKSGRPTSAPFLRESDSLAMLLLIQFLLIFPIFFIHSLIYSFSEYLLSTNHALDLVISTGNTAMNKRDGNPSSYRVTFWRGPNSYTLAHTHTYILYRVNIERVGVLSLLIKTYSFLSHIQPSPLNLFDPFSVPFLEGIPHLPFILSLLYIFN